MSCWLQANYDKIIRIVIIIQYIFPLEYLCINTYEVCPDDFQKIAI